MRKSLRTIIALCAVAFGSTAWAQTEQVWTTGAEVAAGDYYFYNTGTKQYLAPGYSGWGTEAWSMPHARNLTLTANGEGYNIDTQLSNGGSNNYLVSTWMDGAATAWTFTKLADGAYTIQNTTGYLAAANGASAVLTNASGSETNNEWLLITKDMITTAMNGLTYDGSTYVDATPFINCPDVVRNDKVLFRSCWTFTSGSCAVRPTDNGKNEQTANANGLVEIYDQNYDMNQTLTGMPNGAYIVRVQGFYRPGANGTTNTDKNAIFYANESESPMMLLSEGSATSCNSMSDASTAFIAGDFNNNSVKVVVTDGTLKIGLKKNSHITNDWTIFDNFSLEYYGKVIASEAQELPTTGNLTADTWYKYTVTVAGDYYITAGSAIGNVVYTTNGEQALTNPTTTAASATMTLEAGTYYFKSSSEQTLTIEAATKTYEVGDATLNPSDGTYLKSLQSVTISFPNATTNDASASLKILNANGVTCGDQTATLSIDGTTVIATFANAITLDLGGTASVNIAAGTIGYSADYANTEITATYNNGNIADGLYYLYDTTNKTFLSMGADYLTAAVCDDYGMLLNVAMQSDGCYTFQFVATGNYLFDPSNSEKTYTDNSTNNHWVISTSGENLVITDGNETSYKGQSLYNNGTNVINSSSNATSWKLITSDERNKVIAEAQEAQKKSVATSASVESVESYITSHAAVETTTYVKEATAKEYYMGDRVWNPVSVSLFTAESLPEGIYKIHADAFFRSSYYNETDKDAGRAYIKAVAGDNTYKMQIASPFDMTTTSTTEWSSAGPNDVQYGEYYYPNNTTSAAAAMKAGNYGHDLYVYVGEDGKLTVSLDFSGFIYGAWLCYNNVVLYKYADKVTIDETVAYEPFAQTADVDLVRTFNAGVWNTFCVPFAIDNSTLKSVFGESVQVAEFTSYEKDGAATFTTVDAPSIQANTPVIIKGVTAAENNTYSFSGRTIEVADPVVTKGDMKFVGTYTPMTELYTTTESRYVIGSDNKVYATSSEYTTGINGTRAYIVAPADTEVKLMIGGAATGIESINENGTNLLQGTIYTISGQRVNNVSKGGLYIVNGKKVFVK